MAFQAFGDIAAKIVERLAVRFEPGKSYWTRSIVDADYKVIVSVASRTEKTVVTTDGKRLKISVWNGVETVRPWGSYSMAPIVGADREMA